MIAIKFFGKQLKRPIFLFVAVVQAKDRGREPAAIIDGQPNDSAQHGLRQHQVDMLLLFFGEV
jgi:hypothetical protein